MNRIRTQYLVEAPFAWITGALWCCMGAMSPWHCWSFHISIVLTSLGGKLFFPIGHLLSKTGDWLDIQILLYLYYTLYLWSTCKLLTSSSGEGEQRADLTLCFNETCGVCVCSDFPLAAVLLLSCSPCLLHYWGGWDIADFSWCDSCWSRPSGNPIPVCSCARGQLQ